jgi:ATP-dependent Lhr-like helicase
LRLPWGELQWACRRLEDRGLIRGGRWVAGFPGEPYALPEAADHLDRIRRSAPGGELVTVNATDPCNLVGTLLPGPAIPAVRTNHVTYLGGLPVT